MAGIETREVLESWKEISDYLKRTVKTCRRWEQELELPVRRLDGTPKARVFAYKDELDVWLEDKLNNKDLSTTKYLRIAKTKPKKLWIILPISLALILFVIFVIRFIPGIDLGSSPPEKPYLAVLPIQNNTGDDNLLHLQDALTVLIVSDLYQSKYIRVLTAERMNQILKNLDKLDADSFTTEDLERIVSLDGVTHFLSGAVTKFGDKVRLNISLQEAGSWETKWSDHIDGTEDDMFAMVDLLTKKIKPQLNLTNEQITDDFDKPVADVSTRNQRALEFYIQAHRAFNDAEWNLAIDHFERAIALDPDFAMAYRFLGSVYNHLAVATWEPSYWDKFHEARRKSRDAALRRPPSERERLIILESHSDPPDPIKGIETAMKILELFPDDNYVNSTLGTTYYQLRAYAQAEKHIKQIVDFTNSPYPFYHLSNIYLHQGRYAEARKLLERGMERFPDNFFLYQRMAELHAMQKEYEEALFWCDQAFDIEPIQFLDLLVRGDILLFMDDFSAAEKEYRRCLSRKNNRTRIFAALSLIQLYKTQGRYEDAKVQAETAKQIHKNDLDVICDPINIGTVHLFISRGTVQEALKACEKVLDDPSKYKLQGEIYVGAKQWFDAEKVILEIEDAVRKVDDDEWEKYLAQNGIEGPYRKKLRNALYTIEARIALENGDYAQAISHMEEAKKLYPGINLIPADLIDILGRAYYESGNLKSARDQFEWISRMTYNRKEHGDIYAKSYYMLGKIYEELGNERKAMENYEKFLDLWKNADPGLPEIEDARIRLAALR